MNAEDFMQIVDIHEAAIHLSRLVDQAAQGEPFIIARAGRPLVKVVPIAPPQRLGFLAGQAAIPDDFDRMGAAEIEALMTNAPTDCESGAGGAEKPARQSDQKLSAWQANSFELLAMPNGEEIDFDPPKAEIGLKPADFS